MEGIWIKHWFFFFQRGESQQKIMHNYIYMNRYGFMICHYITLTDYNIAFTILSLNHSSAYFTTHIQSCN